MGSSRKGKHVIQIYFEVGFPKALEQCFSNIETHSQLFLFKGAPRWICERQGDQYTFGLFANLTSTFFMKSHGYLSLHSLHLF